MLQEVTIDDVERRLHLISYDERERRLTIRVASTVPLLPDTRAWLISQRFVAENERTLVRRTGPRMLAVIVGRLSTMMADNSLWDAGTISGAMFEWSGVRPPAAPQAWRGDVFMRICQTGYALIADAAVDPDDLRGRSLDIYRRELFP